MTCIVCNRGTVQPGREFYCDACEPYIIAQEQRRERAGRKEPKRRPPADHEADIRAALVFCQLNYGPHQYVSCLHPGLWVHVEATGVELKPSPGWFPRHRANRA